MVDETESALSRIRNLGYSSVGNVDLLAVALTREEKDLGKCEVEVRELVRRYPGDRISTVSPADLSNFGLDPYETARFLSAFQLGFRMAKASHEKPVQITDSESAYETFRFMAGLDKEEFHIALLDTKANLIGTRFVHRGTINMSVVGIREVFREAVRESAASIIVAHNHPSGDPTPSPEDISVTHKLVEAGDLLDISVLDHIIVGRNEWNSLKRLGYI